MSEKETRVTDGDTEGKRPAPDGINQLRAQILAELKAEQAAEAAKTERRTAKAAMQDAKNDRVKISIFKDNDKYKDDVFVAINGVGYRIRRGEEVLVPRCIAEVLEQSMQQDQNTAKMIGELQCDYQTAVELGRL